MFKTDRLVLSLICVWLFKRSFKYRRRRQRTVTFLLRIPTFVVVLDQRKLRVNFDREPQEPWQVPQGWTGTFMFFWKAFKLFLPSQTDVRRVEAEVSVAPERGREVQLGRHEEVACQSEATGNHLHSMSATLHTHTMCTHARRLVFKRQIPRRISAIKYKHTRMYRLEA